MRRLGRWLLWSLLIGVVLVVGVGVGLALWFDAERAGVRIGAFLSARLERPVVLREVSLAWSPLPAIRVDGLSVGDPQAPVARVEAALFQVRLVPLLERRLHLAMVSLEGLELDLRDAGGPVAPLPPGDTGASDVGSRDAATPPIRVDELHIRGGRLRMAGDTPLTLNQVNLNTGPLVPGEPVAVRLQGILDGRVRGPLGVEGTVTMGDGGTLRLGETRVELGAGSLPAPVLLDLASLAADPERLSIPQFRVSGLGLSVQGELQVVDPGGAAQIQGRFTTIEFPARELLGDLGIPPLEDPTALSRVFMELLVSGTPEQLSFSPTVQVDDSTLTGSLVLRPGPVVQLDLQIDRLAPLSYAPAQAAPATPATPAGAVAASASGAGEAPLLPRDLRLDGELRVGALRLDQARVEALRIPLSLHDGILALQPTARLYGGEYQGDIRLDGSRVPARLELNERLRDVQAGPLLAALAEEARITGRTDLDARLFLVPGDAETVSRSLDGELRLAFRDGAYRGVNLAQLLRAAEAVLKGRPPPPTEGVPETDFTELTGTFRFEGGQVRNDDLRGQSPFLRVQGQGSADLLSEALDYRLSVVLVRSPEGQGGAGLAELEGIPVPVQVSGELDNPRFRLDAEALLREQGRDLLEGGIDDLAEEVEDELRDRLGENLDDELGEQLEQEAERLLRGLFR